MTIIAIFLSRTMDSDDLTGILLTLGLGIPAIIVLTLAQWTTNTNNLYSAGLGFSVVFKRVPKSVITIIAGLIATALACFGIYDRFMTFLTYITMLVAPLGGIYTAEYLLVNKIDSRLTGWTAIGAGFPLHRRMGHSHVLRVHDNDGPGWAWMVPGDAGSGAGQLLDGIYRTSNHRQMGSKEGMKA